MYRGVGQGLGWNTGGKLVSWVHSPWLGHRSKPFHPNEGTHPVSADCSFLGRGAPYQARLALFWHWSASCPTGRRHDPPVMTHRLMLDSDPKIRLAQNHFPLHSPFRSESSPRTQGVEFFVIGRLSSAATSRGEWLEDSFNPLIYCQHRSLVLASARFLLPLNLPRGAWVDARTLVLVARLAGGSVHSSCPRWFPDVSWGCRAELGSFRRANPYQGA